ncbi:MAG: amino acid ABC transporter substrate-binding protein [Cellulosilyticaceae bacterium]
MKKLVGIALALSVLMIGVTGCAKVGTTGMEGVKERGKLVVGLDDQFPPMGFRDEKGNVIGFDIDLATAVSEKLGVDVELKPIVWDTKITELNQGEIDVIWNGFTITPEREKDVLFSEPYLENSQVIIVKNDAGINNMADLIGKQVGLQLDSSAQGAVEKFPEVLEGFKNLRKYEDNIQVLMDLELGGIDAAVMDSVVAEYQIKVNSYDFKILDENFGNELYGIGVRKTDNSLVTEINKVLNEMKIDGSYDEISNRWFD